VKNLTKNIFEKRLKKAARNKYAPLFSL